MFEEIPLQRPATPLLDSVNSGTDLRSLDQGLLPQLATELRAFLLYCVGQTGGHFGAGLGVVELTIALHYIYNTPEDRLVWDVGHQSYPHKILSGRREAMLSMRQAGGLSGFPKRGESDYDTFGVGHSSTSISAALGMCLANRQLGLNSKTVAVIGDGAMTAGMAFEALNHAAHTNADMLVILNDNNMSISRNVGGLATYFAKIWASKTYTGFREGSKKVLSKIPSAWEFARRTEEHIKGMVAPGTLFEELGFNYIGPLDGHDLPCLLTTLGNMKDLKGPQLLHLITRKGKGFAPAEADPVGYHALTKIEPQARVKAADTEAAARPKYQDVFGTWLCDAAADDDKVVGITPAMCEGSGMVEFSQRFPERFHDVAIAEQHALTLAAGLACEGMKPVVAIYSTFLQRAYDQVVHDIALQNLDVTLGIDRAGLVGEDGPTHAGSFDLSYLRCLPNFVIATPADENECRQLLHTALLHKGPAAVRYPRGKGSGVQIEKNLRALPIGKARKLREGKHIAILNFGTLLASALEVAERHNATVIDMRFAKPLDEAAILAAAASHRLLVTLEENAVAGGAGSAVAEFIAAAGVDASLLLLGLPDVFVDHGNHAQQLKAVHLDTDSIDQRIAARYHDLCGKHSAAS